MLILQASSLSTIKDVDTQEVASALEELQRGLQGTVTQQCLLSVFSFAETVFQPPACPWPHAAHQYDTLSKVSGRHYLFNTSTQFDTQITHRLLFVPGYGENTGDGD